MSYSAAPVSLMPARHSIDTLTSSWFGYWDYPMTTTWNVGANYAIYCPLRIPSTVVVQKLWFASSTVGTGNVSMGLYLPSGVRVVDGGTAAKSTTAAEQVFDVTDTTIGPGLYYIGLSASALNDTFSVCSNLIAPLPAAFGCYTEASAYPLPSTATFVLNANLQQYPYMGLLIESTVA